MTEAELLPLLGGHTEGLHVRIVEVCDSTNSALKRDAGQYLISQEQFPGLLHLAHADNQTEQTPQRQTGICPLIDNVENLLLTVKPLGFLVHIGKKI